MKVSIWDLQEIEWIQLTGVKRIIQVNANEIDIDGILYSNTRYEINFIDME